MVLVLRLLTVLSALAACSFRRATRQAHTHTTHTPQMEMLKPLAALIAEHGPFRLLVRSCVHVCMRLPSPLSHSSSPSPRAKDRGLHHRPLPRGQGGREGLNWMAVCVCVCVKGRTSVCVCACACEGDCVPPALFSPLLSYTAPLRSNPNHRTTWAGGS